MSTSYLDRAKKKQQMGTQYTFNNMPGNRGSMYEVNNEIEQVIVENNLKNIHRISTSHVKLPNKENSSILSGISNSAYNTFKDNPNLDEKSEISSMKSGAGLINMGLQLQPVSFSNNNNNFQLIPLINKDQNRLQINHINHINDSPEHRNRLDFQNFQHFNISHEMDNSSSYSPVRQNHQSNHISHRVNTNSNHNQHIRSLTPTGTGKNLKSQNFNQNFSEIFKPPVKKGMFSYPKSNPNINTSGLKPASNSHPNFVTGIGNYGNYPINMNISQFHPISYDKNNSNVNSQNILNLQSSVQNIAPLNRSDISNISQIQNIQNIDVSSSNLSIPRAFSDKYQQYQINKVSSNTNLANKSVNLGDDNDSMNMGLKKNESANSYNFNKYKVGTGLGGLGRLGLSDNKEVNSQENLSSSNLFGHSSNSEISNLWNHNLAGIENRDNSVKSVEIYPKENINNISNNINNTKSDRYHTFSNNDKTHQFPKKNNLHNNAEGIQFNPNYSNLKFNPDENPHSYEKSTTNQNSTQIIQENNSGSFFKNKPRFEKESRRMLIEMIKIKMRQISKENGDIKPDVNKILEEMKISPLILDRETNLKTPQNSQKKINTSFETSPRIENLNSQLTNSVEIKNNNFEINNNYFGTINVPESGGSGTSGTSGTIGGTLTNNKSLPQFIYNLEEDTNEKINLLCYLSIPRILRIKIGSNSNVNKVPFMFQLSPTNLCHVYGVEHYILQWSDLYNMAPVGTIDLLKIVSCSMKSDSNSNSTERENNYYPTFIVETIKDKSITPTLAGAAYSDFNKYEIISNNLEECKMYVNALNYLSQLVKCKAYAHKNQSNSFKSKK